MSEEDGAMAYLSSFHDNWGKDLQDVVGRIAIAYGQMEHVLKLAYKRITGKTLGEAMDFAEELKNNAALAREVTEEFAKSPSGDFIWGCIVFGA